MIAVTRGGLRSVHWLGDGQVWHMGRGHAVYRRRRLAIEHFWALAVRWAA